MSKKAPSRGLGSETEFIRKNYTNFKNFGFESKEMCYANRVSNTYSELTDEMDNCQQKLGYSSLQGGGKVLHGCHSQIVVVAVRCSRIYLIVIQFELECILIHMLSIYRKQYS